MIGITMGDANGVGPEILLRARQEGRLSGKFIVIGDHAVLHRCMEHLSLSVPLREMRDVKDYKSGYININNLNMLTEDDITIGRISAKAGAAALAYIREGTLLAMNGTLHALVTLPVHKAAVRLSQADFTGHTDYIASICGAVSYAMMLVAEGLIVTHVSTHVSLKDALINARKERIYEVIRLTHEAVNKLRPQARIAVAGLNPHAGENGAFGEEELKEIIPAIAMAKKDGMVVTGPVAPDTVFYQATHGLYDAVVCMYHDQGHIPLKLLDFQGGVNVTLGLPIVRTSVDHGTAYDIAYQGIASLQSFCNAYELANRLLHRFCGNN